MNIAKNMEAIFIATAVIACAAIYSPTVTVTYDSTPAQASASVTASPAAATIQTVVVKTKRMTAAEKAAYAL